MLSLTKTTVAAILAVTTPAAASSTDRDARTAIIAIDLSSSAPSVTNPQYAASAARWTADYLAELEYRDRVKIRTFGTYDAQLNLLRGDFTLNRTHRPDQVARSIGRVISNLPEYVSSGQLELQNQTNIFGFLENIATAYPCSESHAEIVLISDGFESSSLANSYELSRRDGAAFPTPIGRFLEGCSLTILGVGQGETNPIRVNRLRALWQNWASAAGASSIRLLNSW
jgi:hypothetical protein